MGNRLSTIVTRTGDSGTTGLGDGSRVSKADARVAAMGDVDELNSNLGLLVAFGVPEDEALGQDHAIAPLLARIQQDLFDLGGELSIPGFTLLKAERVAGLDDWLIAANATLPRLAEFIIPGGSIPASQAHVCRTICRRAERSVVVLADAQPVSDAVRQYLNRLSDLLFVMARIFNRKASGGAPEPQWNRQGDLGMPGG
ncbi:cob(I)yrinic acid a,c-diamide adenosyltransferase [soil metagenome]